MMLNEKAPGGRYEDLPLEEMTYDELKALRERTAQEINGIKAQLARQSAEYQEKGVNGDPIWTAKARGALRFKGSLDQKICNEMSRKRQSKKEGNIQASQNQDRWFRKAAHHFLPGKEYEAIEMLAKQMERGY